MGVFNPRNEQCIPGVNDMLVVLHFLHRIIPCTGIGMARHIFYTNKFLKLYGDHGNGASQGKIFLDPVQRAQHEQDKYREVSLFYDTCYTDAVNTRPNSFTPSFNRADELPTNDTDRQWLERQT